MIDARRNTREGGFTLLELLVTMLLLSIMMGLAVAPYRNYRLAQQHLSSTRNIVSILRNAQVRAVAEANTYRVTFEPTTFRVQRYVNNTTWVDVATHRLDDPSIRVVGPSFTHGAGTASYVDFLPRGAATKGQLTVVRSNSGKVYTVSVEGLTARVSYI